MRKGSWEKKCCRWTAWGEEGKLGERVLQVEWMGGGSQIGGRGVTGDLNGVRKGDYRNE